MNRLRLLFVGPMLGCHPGWVPNTMELLAPKLRADGYECRLVSNRLNRYARFFDMVYSMITYANHYDVVCLQVYAGRSFIVEDIISRIAIRIKKGLVLVLHGGNIPNFIRKHQKWSHRVLARAHVRIVPSSYLADALQEHGITAQIIPNHFEIEDCPFRQREHAGPRLLWMRTFDPVYNPEMAVRALSEIRKIVPDCTLTMAGQESGLLESVKGLAVSLGLERQVRFAGFLERDGKKEIFKEHDIFLNTNRIDNMPISVLEAAAFGLPIVATRVGGIPHLLQNEVNALLVPSEDAHSMADAIIRLMKEDTLAAQLSRNGRILAERSSWPQVKGHWEDAFRKAMNSSMSDRGEC